MAAPGSAVLAARRPAWRLYLELTKPKVVALIVFTSIVGTLLASPGLPPLDALIWGNLGVALAAGSAAAINHVLDQKIDEQMSRTRGRPLPRGTLSTPQALGFAAALCLASMLMLSLLVNPLTAVLTFLSLIGYAVVYTVWLKRATSQNIVIGGAAGAFPPMIGWAAATGDVSLASVALFLIVFMWTPPHFWALALFRAGDYAKAGVPMLPVVAGKRETRRQILIYSLPMAILGVSPTLLGVTGPIYAGLAALLGFVFVAGAWAVWRDGAHPDADKSDFPEPAAKRLFGYSIVYLFLLFGFMLLDRVALGA
jgi:protoheme IX farnesyltransferase